MCFVADDSSGSRCREPGRAETQISWIGGMIDFQFTSRKLPPSSPQYRDFSAGVVMNRVQTSGVLWLAVSSSFLMPASRKSNTPLPQ